VAYYFGDYDNQTSWFDSTASSIAVSGFGDAHSKLTITAATFASHDPRSHGIAY
jgi:hypothetical protein